MKTTRRNKKIFLIAGLLLLLYGVLVFVGGQQEQSNNVARLLGEKRLATAKFRAQERVLNRTKKAGARFSLLRDAAKSAANAGEFDKAERYAKEMLAGAPKYKNNWNYGNLIHDGHMVLGRVALARGDKKTAATQLLAAGKTPGSPQLNSFGPNMSLAKEMIEKGETEPVLQYLEECRKFWKSGVSRLDQWQKEIQEGRTPNLDSQLVY